MKAIMVMFDSLNRRMLSPYGCDWVFTPNFQRLADRGVTFDCSYVGSMPCMPARRELHTGRTNFLHRSWGPLEPFDDSMPEMLRENGIHSQLISDHYHYWEEGGCNYHTHYSGWEIVRGQEGDPWKGDLSRKDLPQTRNSQHLPQRMLRQDLVNRSYMEREEDMTQPRTFALGEEFLRANAQEENWFLHLETFDPHEPYFSSKRFQDLYPHCMDEHWDWPPYRRVNETPEAIQHMRCQSAALHSMCDHYLGRVLDLMDELNLWEDTMLIVNTDHGFMLGEHDWGARSSCPSMMRSRGRHYSSGTRAAASRACAAKASCNPLTSRRRCWNTSEWTVRTTWRACRWRQPWPRIRRCARRGSMASSAGMST
jgi:arylsulfatase A-like enzyme